MTTRVSTLPLSISNAYLLLGDRPVLVDAGSPGDEQQLLAGSREHGVAPGGPGPDRAHPRPHRPHGRDRGRRKPRRPGGRRRSGHRPARKRRQREALQSTGPAGALLWPFTKRMEFSGWSPQVRVTEALRLDAYGVGAEMVPVGAHTPGSCTIAIDPAFTAHPLKSA